MNTSEALAKIPAFSNLSKSEIQTVQSLMTPITIPAGDEFITEGAIGHEAFVILEGTAKVTRGGKAIATVGAGDVVGEMSTIGGIRRVATITAETEIKAEALTSRELSALLDEVPALTRKIMVGLISRLAEIEPSLNP